MGTGICWNCHKVFYYAGGEELCPECRTKITEKFRVVKEYIYDHPGVKIPEVIEACDVTERQILRWLREERLSIAEDSAIVLTCKNCGRPINSGMYCQECKRALALSKRDSRPLENIPDEDLMAEFTSRTSGRMRYLGRKKEDE